MDQSISQIIFILENYNLIFADNCEHLKCVICEEILKNARQTSCGCKVCENCINNYLNKGPKSCPNNEFNCKNTILDINEDIYIDKATNKEIADLKVSCPFYPCGFVEKLKNLKDHINNCPLKKTLVYAKKIEFKEKTSNIDSFDVANSLNVAMKHDKLSDKLAFLENNLNDLDSKVNHFQEKINNQKFVVEQLQKDSNNWENDPIILKFIEKSEAEDISFVTNNHVFKNWKYIWKISEFQSKVIGVKNGLLLAVTSEPFYTNEFGFKMCLRIYPLGIEAGEGTHLSVFFVLMKGDYDNILQWPFKYKVKLSLLNNDYHRNNFSVILKPNTLLNCFQKPIGEYNSEFGCSTFITLHKLLRQANYYKNDTIYIKMKVKH